jgi:predicted nucleic acid-binding protein
MIRAFGSLALLDSCVIYPAPLRDLLLSTAFEGLFTPLWTQAIHEEWIRNLLKNRPDILNEKLNETVAAMNNAFPYSEISGFEHLIESLSLPDQNDRHVLAAAIAGKARFIITFNLNDFPLKTLKRYNLQAIHPDLFLVSLYSSEPGLFCKSFKKMLGRLANPRLEPLKVIEILRKLTLTKISAELIKSCI